MARGRSAGAPREARNRGLDEAGGQARHGGEAVRGVALPARGWIACQKSVADAGSIMVPMVRVVVPISGRPNGLKAGHGKPKNGFQLKKLRVCGRSQRTDMPGGAHHTCCCAVTLATPGSLLPVLTPLLLQGRVQPAGQLVYIYSGRRGR